MNLSKFVLYNVLVIFLLLFFEKMYGNHVIFWMTFFIVVVITFVLFLNVFFGVWYLLEYRFMQRVKMGDRYLIHSAVDDQIDEIF